MSEKASKFYAFGPFRVDARRRRLLRDEAPVQLTPKAFDVLTVLIEHRDRVVEKEELMRLVWPDQFVEEANLSVNMSALRKALGERAGESRYVLTVPRRGYRFVAEVVESGADDDHDEARAAAQGSPLAGEFAGAPAAASGVATPAHETQGDGGSWSTRQAQGRDVPNNLPIQLTPFIGRQAEASGVERLLTRDDVRLVTLTGPGGSGKTRLAVQVAAGLSEEFSDGVFFINLDPVNDPHLVVSTIAQTLGVKEVGGTTLIESLKKSLRDQRVLLVLDNFEQVVSAAPLLVSLLEATHRVKVLVTSRALLRLRGEHEFQVPPLLLPDIGRGRAARVPELLQCASVELFVQRAVAAKSDFLLTERNAHAVAEICVYLDGLPLAIELAAARVRVLPPQAMIARLETPFKLLTGGARNLPARQQTMSGAIAWSYDLLDEAGKCLFRRLSVFVGGATLDAAESVCKEAGDADDVQDGVAALVDNSLLRQVEQAGGEPRFVMLETIREYGLRELRASGDIEEARRRHAEYFTRLAEEADPELGGERLNFWLEQLEEEHDNLRAALRWSLERGEVEAGLRLVRSLWWFWYLHGHYHEGREWLNKILAAGGGHASLHRARALTGAGVLAFLQCEYAAAEEHLKEGLTLSRRIADRECTAMALQVLGSVARERGDYARAIERHHESLALWRELNDRRGIARSLNYIGFAAWLSADFEETIRCGEVALPLFREQGDKEGVVWALLNLSAVACYRRDYGRACAVGEESLALSREIGYKEGIAWSLHLLGLCDSARASRLLRESLRLQHELGDRWRMASVLESLGGVEATAGRLDMSAWMFAAAERLREATGTPLSPVEREDRERHVADLRVALGEEAFAARWAEGRSMSLEQIIATSLEPAGD